jgi:hypothetical protein
VSPDRNHHEILSTWFENILTRAVAQLPPPMTAMVGLVDMWLIAMIFKIGHLPLQNT